MSQRVGVKQKLKSAGRLGLKVAIGAGAIAGLALGIKGKGEEKFEEKKAEAEDIVEAGQVVAGAVKGIAVAGARDIKADPLHAKKHAAKSKMMAVGVVAAGAKDPVGAAKQVKFATAPKSQAEIEGQYALGVAPKKKEVFGAEASKASCQAMCYSKHPQTKKKKYKKCIANC